MDIQDIIKDLQLGLDDPKCTKRHAIKYERFMQYLTDIANSEHEFVTECAVKGKERNNLILLKNRFFHTSQMPLQSMKLYLREDIVNFKRIDNFRMISGRPHQAVWNNIRYNIVDEYQDFLYYSYSFEFGLGTVKTLIKFNPDSSHIDFNDDSFTLQEIEGWKNFPEAVKESGPVWLKNYAMLK